MKHAGIRSKSVLIVGILTVTVIGAAWQKGGDDKQKDSVSAQSTAADTTVPGKRSTDQLSRGLKEIDKAMKELEENSKQLDQQMKELDKQLARESEIAIKEIDFDKIRREIDAELRKIDPEKIGRELEAEIGEAGAEKIKMKVKESMRQAEQELQKAELQLKKADIEKMRINIDHDAIRAEVEEGMRSAKKGLEQAKKDLQDLKQFTDELEKDGLIDTSKPFRVDWKAGGELYINGVKQPRAVQDKYSKYYKGGEYSIRFSDDDLQINQGEKGEVI